MKLALGVGALIGVILAVLSSRPKRPDSAVNSVSQDSRTSITTAREPAFVLDEPLIPSSADRRELQPAPDVAVDFEDKYAGLTSRQLQFHPSKVRESRLELQEQITSEREANGQFLRDYRTLGVEFSAREIAKSEVDRQYPQPGQPLRFTCGAAAVGTTSRSPAYRRGNTRPSTSSNAKISG